MPSKTHTRYRLCTAILLAVVAGSAASAQQKKADHNSLNVELVKTGLYVVSGGGCNSLLRLSANGLIVVDSKLPGNYDALIRQVKRVSDQPVRVLIYTDGHLEHTGNNAEFLADGAAILAHENLKTNLAALMPAGGKISPRVKTYDHDFTFRLGGVEAQVFHFGNARTNGDTVVYFPDLKVVAVGGLFAGVPDPDFAAGGSLVGWGPVLAQILRLDFDVAAPSTGPLVTRADLEAFKIKIDTAVSRAVELVKKGVGEDELMAHLKTDDLGWRLNFTGADLDRFYSELSRVK